MKNLRILLVEDAPIYTIKLELMLEELGVKNLKTVTSAEEAFVQIGAYKPTIIISDLFLEGKKTGLDLVEMALETAIPILLITVSQDENFYKEAKRKGNIAYIVKPFHKLTLKSTIDLMMSSKSLDVSVEKVLYIRGNHNEKIRVNYDDILWCEVDRNYSTIITKSARHVVKQSLQKTIIELNDERFVRIHDAYLANIHHIKTIFVDSLEINDQILPLSRTYKKELTRQVKILQSS